MKKLGDIFCAQLHSEQLKPLGFKKKRHTFTRAREGYAELYGIQGSSWNYSGTPWQFYLNCGVSFADLPRRQPDMDFPSTHLWTRISRLLPDAPGQYDVTPENMEVMSHNVADLIRRCSEYFQSRHEAIRRLYDSGRRPLLFGPEDLP